MNLEPHCVILYPDQLTCKPLATAPALDWVGTAVLIVIACVVGVRRMRR